MTIKKLIRRFTNKDKLSYIMNIAFGLSLLMITLQFQFGRTVIAVPEAIINLDHGYITEASQVVRIIEGLISVGLVALGIERLVNGKAQRRDKWSN